MKLLQFSAIVFALVAFGASANPAAATTTTSPAGTVLGPGVTFHFKQKGNGKWRIVMSGGEVQCDSYTIHMDSTNSGGSLATVDYDVTKVKQETCNFEVTVSKAGTIEYHTLSFPPPGKATVTWSGLELAVHSSVGTCVFTTNNTDVGTITGGSPAVLKLEGSLPRTGGNFLCGSSGFVTAEYELTSPTSLYID